MNQQQGQAKAPCRHLHRQQEDVVPRNLCLASNTRGPKVQPNVVKERGQLLPLKGHSGAKLLVS